MYRKRSQHHVVQHFVFHFAAVTYRYHTTIVGGMMEQPLRQSCAVPGTWIARPRVYPRSVRIIPCIMYYSTRGELVIPHHKCTYRVFRTRSWFPECQDAKYLNYKVMGVSYTRNGSPKKYAYDVYVRQQCTRYAFVFSCTRYDNIFPGSLWLPL